MRSNYNLEVLVFSGGRKTGEPGEKRTTNSTLHMTSGPGSEPGSHWWEESAIPPFQLPLCDQSLEKFSNSRVNMNGYFFFLQRISRGL